ncbi:nickel-dependent hydrogenase, b-type cytochrome subunit/YceI-like family protein [Henriciella barbarensis]|uniref:Nickel-dependent hydrogenase, b-type cytochrome subunit/YceI-like family protein n=1 Tax=Henriciella barbarensis TaxID=86342 RepID=A0A399QWQ0_9PROT|nr:cytochrome b/b6 domain-containing protein [Henriciella barbarensis]RIJ23358.1 nickel-dependent hydrogenase, b-type cytochrome subunit/YceI-like family protein [Henriciella barbarensis]
MTRSPRYTAVAIALHWAIAFGILFMIWLGWNMDGKESWFQLHKSVGITILTLTVARIIWRVMNPPPPLPADMKPWESKASHAVHIGFYALMVIMPLTGWLTVSISYDFDIPTVIFGLFSWPDIPGVGFLANETGFAIVSNIHSKLAYVAFALLALHVGGALKHEFGPEEGVLKRMMPGLFGKTGKPSSPPRGFSAAFGAAIGLFLLIAFVPQLFSSGESEPAGNRAAGNSSETSIEPNWVVDYDQSSIAFTFTHEGQTYEGTFGDWTADIDFDASDLAGSEVLVTVNTGSAATPKKLYTDSLKSGEWFGVSAFPQATVRLTGFEETGTSYTANAALSIKDNEVTVPFAFTLEENGGSTVMTGNTTVERTPLDLGQTSDASAAYVSESVRIDVRVVASPAG